MQLAARASCPLLDAVVLYQACEMAAGLMQVKTSAIFCADLKVTLAFADSSRGQGALLLQLADCCKSESADNGRFQLLCPLPCGYRMSRMEDCYRAHEVTGLRLWHL